MRIYSWNIYFRNKRLDEALSFVRNSGANVFCIQEMPKSFLSEFTALYPHHVYAVEMERLLPERPVITYSVILSRYPIRQSGTITLSDHQDELPFRTHLFIWVMKPFGWSRIRDRNAVYADIETSRGLVRVINIHLTLSNPAWRLEEFEAAMVHRDPSLPTIVCGDLNILEHPRVTLINWLAGGKVSDIFRHKRERTVIEKHFINYELTNPLSGASTHPISRSQLAHILLSRDFAVDEAHVVGDRYGSDHHPICVQVLEQKA